MLTSSASLFYAAAQQESVASPAPVRVSKPLTPREIEHVCRALLRLATQIQEQKAPLASSEHSATSEVSEPLSQQ